MGEALQARKLQLSFTIVICNSQKIFFLNGNYTEGHALSWAEIEFCFGSLELAGYNLHYRYLLQ